MAGDLSFLFNGTPPSSVTGSVSSIQNLPDWYQEYLRGIAGQATALAGIQENEAIPAESVAGFTPDQIAAFQQVRSNEGVWQPFLQQQGQALGGVLSGTQGAVNAANQAVSGPAGTAAGSTLPYLQGALSAANGPAQSWTSNYQQYMSPWTQQVVDNIGRLGQRNFQENIMPGVDRMMTGAGQFGSTRNATMLANAARDASADITGQQSQALQNGYATSANIFASDANRAQQQQQMAAQTGLGAASTFGTLSAEDAARQQQQQQMQAQTALGGGQLAASSGLNAGQQYGALGSASSALGLADAQALSASGGQQQALDQTGLNTAYNNALSANQYDWNLMGNLSSVIRGMPLSSQTTQTANMPVGGYNNAQYTQSPLTALGQVYSWLGSK